MIVTLTATAWAALVLVGAWLRRPRPGRNPGLVGEPSQRAVALPVPGTGRLARTAEWVGRLLTSALRRPPNADRDRVVGWAGLTGAVAFVISPWSTPVAVGGVVIAAWWRGRRARRQQAHQIADELPDVVDLFVLAAGSGMNVALAVEAVSRFAGGRMGAALAEIERTRRQGGRLAASLDELPDRVGEPVRPLAVALAGAERHGAPLVPALEALAGEVRLQRRRRAEELARQAPVKLIFPLVLCALPAFALLTVVPLLLATLRSLHP